MKKKILFVFLAASLGLIPGCVKVKMIPKLEKPPEISIVPRPQSVERLAGVFTLSTEAQVVIPTGKSEIRSVADYFIARIAEGTGVGMSVVEIDPALKADLQSKTITFRISEDPDVGAEGYTLLSGPEAILVEAAGPRGFFYAVQTIFELLPSEFYSGKANPRVRWTIPAVRISDAPRYPWRGMLLDVSRHFFPKEFIKSYHRLSGHAQDEHLPLAPDRRPGLADRDQEIPPADRGRGLARGPGGQALERPRTAERRREGDLRRILHPGRHPRDRGLRQEPVTSRSCPRSRCPATAWRPWPPIPQLSCTGGPFTVPPGGVWPITDVYCPGNDETFAFLEDVLTEVIDLFPGEYIHIGGDEVDKANWKTCPKCQARIKAEGLKNEDELQS